MIRSGLPFGYVLLLLIVLWIGFSAIIYKYATGMRGKHLKIALQGLVSTIIAFGLVIGVINLIAILFN
jgi:hypothetical protein